MHHPRQAMVFFVCYLFKNFFWLELKMFAACQKV